MQTSQLIDSEFDTYLRALKEVFHGETWDEIETYAARVWDQSGLAENRSWAEVADRVRDSWQHIQPSAPNAWPADRIFTNRAGGHQFPR